MGNPKGTRYEREVLDYLREQRFDAERLRLTGKEDEGDICIRGFSARVILEAKNVSRMNLAAWVEESLEEAVNYAVHRDLDMPVHPAVVHKRKGRGVGHSYVTMPLNEFLRLLK